jgi:hypothetical protein
MRSSSFGYAKSVKNYLDLAYHPVESAMTNHDDLVHLLVRLGASVNAVPKYLAESSFLENRMSLKDWIDNEISSLDTRIKECSVKPPVASVTIPPEYYGWQKFYKEYQESLKTLTEEERRQVLQKSEKEESGRLEKLEKLQDAKTYYVEVKQLIENYGAKALKAKISKNETATVPVSSAEVEPRSYSFLSTSYYSRGVPQHLLSSYDELYEACYVGDNEKIQSLCLPAEGAQPDSILLNISVKLFDNKDGKRLPEAPEDMFFLKHHFKRPGLRLHSTLCGRRCSQMVHCKVDPCNCGSTISARR